MSGRYPYGIGNPPTLRRSSFPQRALRPAGDPIPKHAWGCALRPPNAQAAAGYELDFSATAEKLIRTAPQIRSQGACGAFYWGNCKPIAGSHAVETMGWISSYLSRRPLPRSGGGVGGAEPSAASGGCSEAEHPQRSKKSSKRAARRFFRAPQGGGADAPAAPYKHRLAYAPGGR